jgi:thymidylate synthase (FAD)
MTFEVKMPIFVARQLMRHRTGHFVEKSLRYCEAKQEAYIPSNIPVGLKDMFDFVYEQSFAMYEYLIVNGVEKEQARVVIPLGTYTTVYMQFDLRNLKNLLELRTEKHAQAETQWYSNAMLEMVKEHFPTIGEAIG